jgi:hypothetical protein
VIKIVALFLLTVFSLTSTLASAEVEDLIERSFSGVSKVNLPAEAKKDIQERAIQKVSEDLIVELIGEGKFQKNRSLINSKIIRNSAKYIPYLKATNLAQNDDEFKMSVLLKINLRDVKHLLQTQGILNENDTAPEVLPLISWIDRVEGRSFRWWLPIDKNQSAFFIKEGRLLDSALRAAFQKNNFYLLKPIDFSLGMSIPTEFQNEKAAIGDYAQALGQFFNAPLLIDGQVILSRSDRGNSYRIDFRMTAIQVSNGRAIADVSRRYETEVGLMESKVDKKLREVVDTAANDLASQVGEAWQRGSLGTSIVRLTIRGRMTILMIENLKEKIRSEMTQIKNIHERLITSDAVTFELDTSMTNIELVDKILALDFEGKKLTSASENAEEITLKWSK